MNAFRTSRLLAAMGGLAFTAVLYAAPTDAQPGSAAVSRGEWIAADQQVPLASTKTREQRKAETLAANRNGGLGSPGQSLYRTNMAQRDAVAHTTMTRADRKADTLQAIKDHKVTPAGEAG